MKGQIPKPVVTLCSLLAGLSFLVPAGAVRADWIDWWRTPEQQAEAALESGDIDSLKSIAPDALWEGVAEHKGGEFEAAAQNFDREAIERFAEGQVQAANRALYNRGVSEVLNEQYENAVQTFNQVLETDPQFPDAQHNRDIAMQLVQQQQEQEQEQEQSQEGDEQNQDDASGSEEQSSASDNSGEPSEDGEPDDSSEQQDRQSADAGQDGEEPPDADADSEEQRRQDEQAAQDALEAEAQDQGFEPSDLDDGSEADDNQQAAGVEIEEPLSESEQATEQWLRRIPDDPAGLLRRKLQQSHQLEYPEVRDAQQPW